MLCVATGTNDSSATACTPYYTAICNVLDTPPLQQRGPLELTHPGGRLRKSINIQFQFRHWALPPFFRAGSRGPRRSTSLISPFIQRAPGSPRAACFFSSFLQVHTSLPSHQSLSRLRSSTLYQLLHSLPKKLRFLKRLFKSPSRFYLPLHTFKMRFAAVTVALFAGLAAALPNGAESTVYQTEEVTITSCAPTVTDCPARATQTGAVPTVSVPAGGVSPVGSSSVSNAPAPVPTSVAPVPAGPSVTVVPVVHTTCAAVTSWSTITLPTASSPVGGSSGVPKVPSSVAPVR